jgi:Ca2+-binding RTX toxin-like protein
MTTWQFLETTGDQVQTVSASKNWFLDGSNYLVLDRVTTVVSTTAAQYTGMEIWVVDRNTAQTLLNNNGVGSFSGWKMHDPSLGGKIQELTLPAGQYFIFGYYPGQLSPGQTVSSYSDLSVVSAAGESQVGGVAMSVSGAAGSWNAQQFVVSGAPDIYVKAEAGGGNFVIMTDAQYQQFRANSAGYVAGTPPHLEQPSGFGSPSSNMEGEFDLAPGSYWVVWYNNSGVWSGGGAYIKAFGAGGGTISGDSGTPGGGSGGGSGGSGGNLITGTAGADVLTGGDAAETISGAAGNDQISAGGGHDSVAAGSGNDTVYGGLGNDTIQSDSGSNYLRGDDGNDVIVGGTGFDDANGNAGNDTVSAGAGDDWAVGGKDNDSLSGESGGDVVWGNLGNDTCDGGDGNDQVRGGQGDDSVSGGAGDDYVSGDRGNDTIAGGAGADRFHGSQDAGIDRVLDFRISDGDKVMLDPGTTYSVSQMGADTVIDMGGGHQMILVGVTLSSLPAGWIFLG